MRLLAVALVLAGCPTGTSDPDPDSDTELPEGCEIVDCDDPACADVFECTWPAAMSHDSSFRFTGAQIQCPLGPVMVPVDVPDCVIEMTASLTERTTGDVCAACDRTFEGPITYTQDTCSEVLGETPPDAGAWGFVFVSPTARELWLPGEGGWAKSSDLVLEEGVWTTSTSERVERVPPGCGSDVQYVGDVDVEANFRDL